MILYQTTLILKAGSAEKLLSACRELPDLLGERRLCPCRAKGNTVEFIEITDGETAVTKRALAPLLHASGTRLRAIKRREIDAHSLLSELAESRKAEFLSGEATQDILRKYRLQPFADPIFDSCLGETFLLPETTEQQPEELFLSCVESRSAREEISRIGSLKGLPFYGYPAAYLIQASSREQGEALSSGILSAFYRSGCLQCRRGALFNADVVPVPNALFEDLYVHEKGGSVTVCMGLCTSNAEDENMIPYDGLDVLPKIVQLAERHRSDVLTIFLMIGDQSRAVDLLRQRLHMSLIELSADGIPPERACRLMEKWACEAGIPLTDELRASWPAQQSYASEEEAEQAYAEWLNGYLAQKAYPQYAFLSAPRPVGGRPAADSALSELQSLIGLDEVKQIIRQAADYAAAQRLYEQRGLSAGRPCLHMVFSGNPGTAKTTVARLVARIFHECGVLSRGGLIEVGRGDLVGKYVGWTAQQVQSIFRKAKGSVLFIDEAYSLLEYKDGMFGDEAINAIVQEMENCREDTVVILAGYSEPMQKLLDRNAGLRSRIAFTVNFPDYRDNELVEIARKLACERRRTFTPDAEEKLTRYLSAARLQKNFGNGRSVRALIEKALLRQSSRLMALPSEAVSDEDILTLQPDDFPEPPFPAAVPVPRRIGFCA